MLAFFRRPALRRLCTALAIPSLAAACHRHIPVTGTGPIGARVSVSLTDRGTAEMARFVGPGAGAVEGRLIAADDSAVTLSVTAVRLRNGIENYWTGEHVAVERSLVASFTERRVSRPRTAAAAAGFTLLVSAIAAAFILGASGGSGEGDTNGSGQR
ncbi:MAG TPA: hypothetical protein VNA89_04485 [Gemmatimonadaceae bacterium]|nr:hypothetical protein [Gemmatimonadaceae bacterium]